MNIGLSYKNLDKLKMLTIILRRKKASDLLFKEHCSSYLYKIEELKFDKCWKHLTSESYLLFFVQI